MTAPGRIDRISQETPNHVAVRLKVGPELSAAYTAPGQVLRFSREDDDPVYLALCSDPGESPLELLLGRDAMEALGWREGDVVELDPPIGTGYPVETARGRDVLLFGVGSGLAPLRPVVRMLCRHRADYGWIRLYVGARAPDGFPFASEFAEWSRDRVDIHRAISKPYVQHLFADDPPDLSDAVAFVCGMDAMMADVSRVLTDAGLDPKDIHRNW
jgi:NAD(P)H-flavin reductase